MKLAGWRGILGRSVPAPLIRRILEFQTKHESLNTHTTLKLRKWNDAESSKIAELAGIRYQFDSSSRSFVVQADDWELLQAKLSSEFFSVRKLVDGGSVAASSIWSVDKFQPEKSNSIADLSGSGSLWQVYPGSIDYVADVQDFCEPIDAVYTWVDSDDPQWRSSYEMFSSAHRGSIEASSADLARFTSRDELRYSLRSLELNMPWINKVYLVTCGQRPSWLQEDHPKLTVVDHEQIFDQDLGALPTFNSHAIESRLSFIPGLSEHFLYINDDVFFGRPLHPNNFFGPVGQAKFSMSHQHFANAVNEKLPVNAAASNNRNLMLRSYDRTTSRKFKHTAHPQRLSIHRLAYAKFRKELENTARHKFRDPLDVSLPSSLAHQIAAREGKGIHSEIDYFYLDIGDPDFYLQALRLVKKRQPQMFCINEVCQTDDAAQRSETVIAMLQAMYPIPSSFEK